MFKSETANRVISLVLYWFLAIIVLSDNWDLEENLILLITIAIITILYTVYQLLGIFKEKKK